MNSLNSAAKSVLSDLYLKPALVAIAFYQIIATGTYTAQQILLAAYLDNLGYLENYSVVSGLILSIFFVFWFFLGPLFGSLSDRHGRKFLLISSNLVSAVGFFGLATNTHPLVLFLMNAFLGIGASLRIGSVIAFWVQKTPQERISESMAYINLIIGGGGIGATLIAFYLWAVLAELVFVVFSGLLILSILPIIPLTDEGEYLPFSLVGTMNHIKIDLHKIAGDSFFLSKPIIQVSIHWVAFSVIISFGTFLIPILERFLAEITEPVIIPPSNAIILGIGLLVAILGGLIIGGRLADKWGIKPVLTTSFIGTGFTCILLFIIFQFEYIGILITGFAENELTSWIALLIILLSVFMAVPIVSTPLSWIISSVGKENTAKAMSLRMAFIGLGTIIGTSIGGFIIVNYGLSGLLLMILVFVVISAVLLL